MPDATGANASATEGVNISPSAGGSGTGGTGPVGISASAVNPTLCFGDSTYINATAIPGTEPYTFKWVQTGGPCPGALPDVDTAINTFTPCQGGQFQVKVIVTDAAETQAETTVNVFAVDPLAQLPAGCNDNNSCTQDTCGGGVCTNADRCLRRWRVCWHRHAMSRSTVHRGHADLRGLPEQPRLRR